MEQAYPAGKEFQTAIVWFRRDLRVDDNPALVAALNAAVNVVSQPVTYAPTALLCTQQGLRHCERGLSPKLRVGDASQLSGRQMLLGFALNGSLMRSATAM